jgi:hypothetical protein
MRRICKTLLNSHLFAPKLPMAERLLPDMACTRSTYMVPPTCTPPHPTSLPRRMAACYQPFKRPFKLQRRQHVVTQSIPHPATEVPRLDSKLDDQLSNRPLELDPAGYFIIKVDRESREIVGELYSNTINKDGACDPQLCRPQAALSPKAIPSAWPTRCIAGVLPPAASPEVLKMYVQAWHATP